MKWFVSAAVLISTPALASDWVLISSGPNIGDVSVDVSSATSVAESITIWEKWDFKALKVKKTLKDRTISERKSRVTYNCKDKTFGIIQTVYYDSDGSVIDTVVNFSYSAPNSVVPDTIGEQIMKSVCKLN